MGKIRTIGKDIHVPNRVYLDKHASMDYVFDDESIEFRIDDVPVMTLSKVGITAVGIPEPPFDVNVINSIPISVTTLQILSTEITSFDASLQDANGNLLTVLSDDYSSTVSAIITDVDIAAQTTDLNVNLTNSVVPVIQTSTINANINNFPNPQNVNLTQIRGFTCNTNQGAVDNGTQRVILTNDYLGTVSNNLEKIGPKSAPIDIDVNDGMMSDGTQRVCIANDNLVGISIDSGNVTGSIPVSVSAVTITDIDTTGGGQTSDLDVNITNAVVPVIQTSTVNANINNFPNPQNVNLTQIRGFTCNTNQGAVDNGTQRVILTNDYLGTVSNNLEKIGPKSAPIDIDVNDGMMSDGTQRVCIANDNLVGISIDSTNVTGSIPVSASSTITDIDTTGGGQTSDLNVNLRTVGGSTGFLTGPDKIKVDLNFLGANTIKTGPGSSVSIGGLQRVVLTDDYVSTVNAAPYFNGIVSDFGSGSSTENNATQRVILATDQPVFTINANAGTDLNTSLLALENDGNLDDINSSTASILIDTTSISSSVSTINTKTPALGQTGSTGSVPVVIANDQSVFTVTANAGTDLNTSLLALENNGNLDDINSSTASILIDTTSISSSVSTINTKTPNLGQATMAASVPVAIANNQSTLPAELTTTYLSTATIKNYVEENLTYYTTPILLNSNANLNQTVSPSQIQSSLVFLGGTTRYLHKIAVTTYNDGIVDVNGWGTGSTALTNGWHMWYIRASGSMDSPFTGASGSTGSRIKTNREMIKFFDNFAMESFGTGEDIIKVSMTFDPLIKITSTGSFVVGFGVDNYANTNVTGFYINVSYWS